MTPLIDVYLRLNYSAFSVRMAFFPHPDAYLSVWNYYLYNTKQANITILLIGFASRTTCKFFASKKAKTARVMVIGCDLTSTCSHILRQVKEQSLKIRIWARWRHRNHSSAGTKVIVYRSVNIIDSELVSRLSIPRDFNDNRKLLPNGLDSKKYFAEKPNPLLKIKQNRL